MNLRKKKQLAAKALGVGKNRVKFNSENLAEIKEAVTKQDIRTLFEQGIISINPIKGRAKVKKRRTRRGSGKIKIKVKNRKQDYVKITRKLRAYLKELKARNAIDLTLYREIRKKIKMRVFRSKSHLQEYLEGLKKLKVDEKSSEKTEKKKSTSKKTKKETKQ